LHPEDAVSIKLWVEKLHNEKHLVFYKDRLGSSPPGLPVLEDQLILCIQTEYQLNAFRRLGHRFIGIDTTHNTTQYKDIMLYTIVAQDDWGHGALLIYIWSLVADISDRRPCRLDALVINEKGCCCLFSQLGEASESGCSAINHYDRS